MISTLASTHASSQTSTADASTSGDRMIQIETRMRGILDVAESQIIDFVQPLIGFDAFRRFVIFQTQPGPMYWLQAVDAIDVAFCLLAPFEAGLNPDMAIGHADARDIGASSSDDIAVYTLLVLDPDPQRIRTNLRAPILLGRSSSKAKQLVLDDPRLSVQFHLYPAAHVAAASSGPFIPGVQKS